MRPCILAFLLLLPTLSQALTLERPVTAVVGFETDPLSGTYDVAIGAFDGAIVPTETATGTVLKSVWRFNNAGLTTFQMLDPLTAQLEDQGYQTLFACESRGCGGFDFRFGIDLIPTPDMFVDLGDFRYLAARKAATDGPEYVTLLVSRTSVTGFVHIVTIGNGPSDVQVTPSTKTMDTPLLADIDTSLVQQLEQNGHVILSDLAFETGSSTLGPQTFSSLTRLASYLNERRDRQVALVGHTDAQGSLAGNIALSKRRAAAVRTRLIERYDVEPTQMEAEGVGYLAPVASNLTAEGRDANRRVEVILRSTD